jgi:hypothetical protein
VSEVPPCTLRAGVLTRLSGRDGIPARPDNVKMFEVTPIYQQQ